MAYVSARLEADESPEAHRLSRPLTQAVRAVRPGSHHEVPLACCTAAPAKQENYVQMHDEIDSGDVESFQPQDGTLTDSKKGSEEDLTERLPNIKHLTFGTVVFMVFSGLLCMQNIFKNTTQLVL